MRVLSKFRFIVFLTIAISCSSKNKTITSNKLNVVDSNEKNTVLHFQKTSCNGRCPTYSYKLYDDLSCELDVTIYFIVEGLNYGKISKNDFDSLIVNVETANFFKLNDVYDNPYLQDVPPVLTAINYKGKSKSIRSVVNVPKELIKLQTQIESLIKKTEWKKK